MSEPIRTACILGGGSAGWLTALAFRRLLPEVAVTLVRSATQPVIGVGESTTASVPQYLHKELELDRGRFFREVQPVWKLGIRFEWGPAEISHFNYSFQRQMLLIPPGLPLHSAFYCLTDARDAVPFSALMDRNLSPVFVAADGVKLREGAAYHLDNPKFLAHLEQVATETGVTVVTGDMQSAVRRESGEVEALELAEGQRIEGDLFIDCSGFRSELLGKVMGQEWRSYRKALFCDTAIVGNWQNSGVVQPYTTAETMSNGWCWRIDHVDHVNHGYVYASDFVDQEQAVLEMRQRHPQLEDDLKVIRFPSGRVDDFWTKNVVGIGNSAGFVEPLESSGLHMAAESAIVLCRVLKESDSTVIPAMRSVYNRVLRRKWDDVRDFLALHYRFNRRLDSPFWRHCREQTDIGGAEEVVRIYQEAGPVSACGDSIPPQSIFGLEGYLTLLIGQRVPTARAERTDAGEQQQWRAWQEDIQSQIRGAFSVRDALSELQFS